MKCSKPFILSYNRIFEFLNERGYEDVEDFWHLLSEAIFERLRYLISTEGVVGMVKYWTEVLTAEGAEFELDYKCGKQKTLDIVIRACPSLREIRCSGKEPSHIYCNHCKFIYSRILEEFGYTFKVISANGGCAIEIEEKQ